MILTSQIRNMKHQNKTTLDLAIARGFRKPVLRPDLTATTCTAIVVSVLKKHK